MSSNAIVHAVGFPLWKRKHVRTFLQPAEVRFVSTPSLLARGEKTTVATWGLRLPDEQFPPDCVVWRLEDGFLRSVGLGTDLTPPLSWVKDVRGIYYDPSGPSDLEHLLATHHFSAAQQDRAKALGARIRTAGLTKYNVGSCAWRRPAAAARVILVPGQVESDASILRGTRTVTTNLALLQAVRRAEPDAYVLYKPHPDVAAGLRKTGRGEDQVREWCHEVVAEASMGSLLETVDEIHTMTSLAGFEGLLRDKKVVTYGMPFYAGWGLTEDRDMAPEVQTRRRRNLHRDELVAACLVLYPIYAGRDGRLRSGPEETLNELSAWREEKPIRWHTLRPVLRLLSR